MTNEFLPVGLNRDRMRSLMASRNLDGVLLTSPENVFYVTGFTTLPTAGNPILYLLRNRLPFFAYIDADGRITRVQNGAVVRAAIAKLIAGGGIRNKVTLRNGLNLVVTTDRKGSQRVIDLHTGASKGIASPTGTLALEVAISPERLASGALTSIGRADLL